ncbi:hypothetical protein CDAR_489881 [Caerostris darwini]|uniref:Uncharacterized protein n=1 Tax=Caerostris darwini TaxID=1538125 RepID=A0AAV4S9T4_9ARAC|nr:hypothetical protein CDAR_489881 [Caerostris darwini]
MGLFASVQPQNGSCKHVLPSALDEVAAEDDEEVNSILSPTLIRVILKKPVPTLLSPLAKTTKSSLLRSQLSRNPLPEESRIYFRGGMKRLRWKEEDICKQRRQLLCTENENFPNPVHISSGESSHSLSCTEIFTQIYIRPRLNRAGMRDSIQNVHELTQNLFVFALV